MVQEYLPAELATPAGVMLVECFFFFSNVLRGREGGGYSQAMSRRGTWVFWVAPPIRLMETVTSLKASGAVHSMV